MYLFVNIKISRILSKLSWNISQRDYCDQYEQNNVYTDRRNHKRIFISACRLLFLSMSETEAFSHIKVADRILFKKYKTP